MGYVRMVQAYEVRLMRIRLVSIKGYNSLINVEAKRILNYVVGCKKISAIYQIKYGTYR